MDTSWPLMKLVYGISEENYDCTFSAYSFWIKLGIARGGLSNDQLYNDILGSVTTKQNRITTPQLDYNSTMYYNNVKQYVPRGQLIHDGARLLPRFITDAELDPALSTYAIGLHDRLCRESLDQFFRQNLDYIPGGWKGPTSEQSCEFYTRVNLIAHWVNLGYVKLEDIRDHILQSLAFQPTVYPHQLNSLMILLKLSGATFAAYVDPSVMDRCCDLLKPSNLSCQWVLFELAEVRTPILTVKINYEVVDYRRFYSSGKAVGKAFLLLRSSAAYNPKSLPPSLRILPQLRLRRLWGSRAWWNSLQHRPRRHLPRIIPHVRVQDLPLPHLRRQASPPCPTSRSLIVLMMSRSSNLK